MKTGASFTLSLWCYLFRDLEGGTGCAWPQLSPPSSTARVSVCPLPSRWAPHPHPQGVAQPLRGPWPVFGCDLKTLTHNGRGSHVVSGVTVADCIRFRMFVVLISVCVPKNGIEASQGALGLSVAASGAASADRDTCNELRESPQGPVPRAQFGFPPAAPSAALQQVPSDQGKGLPSVGEDPRLARVGIPLL